MSGRGASARASGDDLPLATAQRADGARHQRARAEPARDLGRVAAVACAVGDVRLDGEVRKEERVLVDHPHAALLRGQRASRRRRGA